MGIQKIWRNFIVMIQGRELVRDPSLDGISAFSGEEETHL